MHFAGIVVDYLLDGGGSGSTQGSLRPSKLDLLQRRDSSSIGKRWVDAMWCVSVCLQVGRGCAEAKHADLPRLEDTLD